MQTKAEKNVCCDKLGSRQSLSLSFALIKRSLLIQEGVHNGAEEGSHIIIINLHLTIPLCLSLPPLSLSLCSLFPSPSLPMYLSQTHINTLSPHTHTHILKLTHSLMVKALQVVNRGTYPDTQFRFITIWVAALISLVISYST